MGKTLWFLFMILIGCASSPPKHLKLVPPSEYTEVVLLNQEGYFSTFMEYINNEGWNKALGTRFLVPRYGSSNNLECGKIYVLFSDIPPIHNGDPDPIGLKRVLGGCLTLIQLEPALLDRPDMLLISLSHELGHAFGLGHSFEKFSIMSEKITKEHGITERDIWIFKNTKRRRLYNIPQE